MSQTGIGKSHLVKACLIAHLAKGISGLFVPVAELFSEMRALLNKPGSDNVKDEGIADTYEQYFDAVKKIDLLILDDIGAQKLTEWVLENMFMIIDYRCRYELKTYFTTNIRSIIELRKYFKNEYGERICSRMLELCDFVVFDDKNYRLTNTNLII